MGNLIDIVGDVAQQFFTPSQLRDFQVDNVAINRHFADKGAHVVNASQRHLLLNQVPLFLGNLEINAFLLFFSYNKNFLL